MLRSSSPRVVFAGLVVLVAVIGLYLALAPARQTSSGPTPEQPEDEQAALRRLDASAPASAKERQALAARWLAWTDQSRGAEQLHAFRRAYHWYRLALWQLGQDEANGAIAGMARAAAAIEPVDAAEARFTLYAGNWRTTYGNLTRDYFVRDDGLILIRDASDGRAGWQGQALRKNGVVLFSWEKGSALDKPTQRGNRWELERFVASDYPHKILAKGNGDFTGPDAPGSFTPAQLVVCGKRGLQARLFQASFDGGLEELGNETAQSLCPAWSPDGTKIVFASTRDGDRRHLFIMDADGKNVQQLTSGTAECRCPAWSPDGHKIAFAKHLGLNAQVFVMDADGSNHKNLTNDGAFSADPAWSPDGSKIAFASNRSVGGFRLYVMNADGSNQRELSREGNVIGSIYPAWSPDGATIVYSGPYQGGLALYAVDPDGQQHRRLTDLPGKCTFAAWSPDGKAVAFANFFGATNGIYVVSPRGTQVSQTPIRYDLVDEDGRIAWRPRGTANPR